MVQLVCTTEAGWPEEPTSPVMLESVQVTAPRPPGVALSTAKLEAEPNPGALCANAACVSSANAQTEKYF
jgi:hypothetical protein